MSVITKRRIIKNTDTSTNNEVLVDKELVNEEETPQYTFIPKTIETKTIKTRMTRVEGKPFVRLFGWGIFLEEASKKQNAGVSGDVIIKYQGEITPQKLNGKIISWELC